MKSNRLFFALIIISLIMLTACEKKENINVEKYNYYSREEYELDDKNLFVENIISLEKDILIEYSKDEKWSAVLWDKETCEILDFDYTQFGLDSIDNTYIYYEPVNKMYVFANVCDGIITVYNESNELLSSKKVNDNCELYWMSNLGIDSQYLYFYISDEIESKIVIYDYELNELYSDNSDENYDVIENNYKGCRLYKDEWFYFDGDIKKIKDNNNTMLLADENVYLPGDSTYDYFYYVADDSDKNMIGVIDNQKYKLFSLDRMNMNNLDNVVNTHLFSDGNEGYFYCVNLFDENTRIYRFLPSTVQMKTRDEREKIVLAGDLPTDRLDKLFSAFNDESDNYEIIFKSYDAENEEELQNMLYKDILKGDEIDGVFLANMSKTKFVNGGCLLDLNDYFNNSNVIKKSDFMDSVIDDITEEDGKIYSLYSTYYISGILSSAKYNFADISSYKDEINSNVAIMPVNEIWRELAAYLDVNYTDFINDEWTQLNNIDELRDTIEFFNLDNKKISPEDNENPMLIMKDSALFYDGYYEDINTILFWNEIYDRDMKILGYDDNHAILVPGLTEMGIVSGSKNIQGMYELFDFMFNEENYFKYFGLNYSFTNYSEFPVLKSSWDDVIMFLSSEPGDCNKYGLEYNFSGLDCTYGDVSYYFDNISDEQIDLLKNIVNNVVPRKKCDSTFVNIIEKEANEYYEGRQSLDRTMDNIEKKVNNFLIEKE